MLQRLRNLLRRRRLPTFPPTKIGDITVQCYAQWPVDEQLISRWKTLADSLESGTPFQTPEWQTAAWHALQGRDLRLFTFERGHQLLGVLPMHFDRQGTLTTFGAGVSDYLDPLFLEPQPILKSLFTIQKNVTFNVTFCNICESSPLRTGLPAIAEQHSLRYQEKIVEYAPAITLPKTWEDYLATLDAHERKELKRKINKAQREASARLIPTLTAPTPNPPGMAASAAINPPPSIRPPLATALKFMEASGGEKGSATHKYLRPLLERAAPPLIADGQLDLLTLYLHDQPACCLLQFRHAAGPMLYNCGYDPAMKQWSPGQVAIGLAIQNAIASGFPTYDMLRGQEPYKYRLGAIDHPLFRITLTHPF